MSLVSTIHFYITSNRDKKETPVLLAEADALNELLARCVSLPTAAAAALLPPPPLQLQPPAPQTTYPANATLFSSVLLAASNWEVRRDMLVANDLIGCVIGRGGMKINEIRKASQATIWISNDEKFQYCSRLITIIGSPMAVDSAISMINARPPYCLQRSSNLFHNDNVIARLRTSDKRRKLNIVL
ncbi:Poly(rC)-binding protein [Echinococcus granulosus]|uniref:Poly(RC)-binding protein n=1 Tax=Echinococcus granulosus TaxID=6210 RepID=W6UWK8_ECHGR|nr:Poly(rC)-binding protein [Echinococcus granulosus]EUB65021.1 Poly(rC)-binding protein [Echinococcus granulosus]